MPMTLVDYGNMMQVSPVCLNWLVVVRSRQVRYGGPGPGPGYVESLRGYILLLEFPGIGLLE